VIDPSVLIVEDDQRLRSLILRGLREAGFRAEGVVQASEVLERLPHVKPDVLVIDVGLPDADGRDLCQALRARGVQTPVLFLTARDAVVDRVAGFDAGGDDYLTKPFAFVELVARLQALLKRAGTDAAVEAVGVRLDPVTHSVGDGVTEIPLTPTEFRLLAHLLARPGEVVRRRDLARAAWSHGAVVRENTLDVYIARLRRKLKGIDGAPDIATVHGVGYRIA
jgi:DNA-binding response OmpR family regulator